MTPFFALMCNAAEKRAYKKEKERSGKKVMEDVMSKFDHLSL